MKLGQRKADHHNGDREQDPVATYGGQRQRTHLADLSLTIKLDPGGSSEQWGRPYC